MLPSDVENGRRSAIRFKLDGDLFAVLRPRKSILGTIIDISQDGFSFSYMALVGEETGDRFHVDLFLSGDGFLSKNIVCKTVSDRIESNSVPFSSILMRRVRARFIDLTTKQRSQLKFVLINRTRGRVADRRCGIDRRSGIARRTTYQRGWRTSERRNTEDRRMQSSRRYVDLHGSSGTVH
jgi:hypothetical protein